LEPSNPTVPITTTAESSGDTLPDDSPAAETPESGLDTALEGGLIYDLDGNGDPMELRFDFPFDDFDGLYVNGELWAPGMDYTARSGSTIITISAARLAQLGAGTHALTAVFAGEPVEIVFTLNAPAQIPQAPAILEPVIPQMQLPGILPELTSLTEQLESASAFPGLLLAMSIIPIGFAAWLVFFHRRRSIADR